MKKLLLSLAAVPCLAIAAPQDDNHEQGHSRFWDYYNPYPSNYIGSREWWEGEALLGDFWGLRNMIDDAGVDITATYANNIAGNVTGGKSRGFTYADNLLFGVELDMDKLIGWDGLSIVVSGLNRNGTSLSQDYIGNQFTVQQIYGGSAVMFYALYFDQKLLDDKVSIKVGRFATGDDFASSPIYWLYMNNGIDGNPQSLPVNTQFSAYPWAVWGGRVRIDPTPEYNAMFGVYQVSNRVFTRNYHGLDWSMRSNDGVLLISQFGWTPELFKRPVEVDSKSSDGKAVTAPLVGSTSSGKSVADGKSGKVAAPTVMKGLPGHYWFGAYYSPWQFSQFGTDQKASNSYGFYWHADQMLWQEAPGSDQGLTLWTAITLSPQQNIARLPFQVNGGLVYKGLIPYRDQDYTTFGVVYGKFSTNWADVTEANGQGRADYELVFEWGYKIQITKFAFVQPDVQWVINPGGTNSIPNALVLGAQMGVTF